MGRLSPPLSQKFVPAPLGEEPRLNTRSRGSAFGAGRAFWGGARLRPPQNARLRLKFGSAPRSARGAGGSAPSEEPPARRAPAPSIHPSTPRSRGRSPAPLWAPRRVNP